MCIEYRQDFEEKEKQMLDVNLEKVLADFGEALGVGLAFDKAGSCLLTVGDESPVVIQANVDDCSLTISSALRDAMPTAISLDQAQNLLALALDPYDRTEIRRLRDHPFGSPSRQHAHQ